MMHSCERDVKVKDDMCYVVKALTPKNDASNVHREVIKTLEDAIEKEFNETEVGIFLFPFVSHFFPLN